MENSILKNQNGLTLLEVMISMIVLSAGLLGLAPMVVLSIEGNMISRDVQTASNVARDKVEYYRGLDSLPALPFQEYEQNVAKGINITSIISDSTSDSLIPSGLCKLDVVINWNADNGLEQSTRYITYLERK